MLERDIQQPRAGEDAPLLREHAAASDVQDDKWLWCSATQRAVTPPTRQVTARNRQASREKFDDVVDARELLEVSPFLAQLRAPAYIPTAHQRARRVQVKLRSQ
eukprot:CAMPEP_0198686570 /NCGR_PEP_ID=MMETSP1468-20131203/15073_1 /TAXON_ID=1461545 /ORGANISM="Mantoniella sp, Strain CCMP1436" /LENGTH=103 /DNA_ID=CAMNT_0044432763 /DNA_START=256 /DNA_END=567 /DNA_ORIENTATION=-